MSDEPRDPLPPALLAAVARLEAAHAAICERTAECLNLGAMSSSTASQRELLGAAYSELIRQRQRFDTVFRQAFATCVAGDWRPPPAQAPRAAADCQWDALSLVDDQTLDAQLIADRFGMAISTGCEWELRELDGYVRAIYEADSLPRRKDCRNPLRPELIGQAVIRALHSLQAEEDTRRVLETELARSWKADLPAAYTTIKTAMRAAGIAPVMRPMASRPAHPGVSAALAAARPLSAASSMRGAQPAAGGPAAAAAAEQRTVASPEAPEAASANDADAPFGQVSGSTDGSRAREPISMPLLRRLAAAPVLDSEPVDIDLSEPAGTASPSGADPIFAPAAPLRNLIQTHRAELVQATHSAMDHRVIDVVGSLFEQILADPKVPPQIARQIARLQLPVLRTALGDPTFFASRRHPVRRLVNRIASLGTALDDLAPAAAEALVGQIGDLVQRIVGGDFDQVDLYEAQLRQLESYLADQGRRGIEEQGTARLLADREAELRMHRRRMRQLETELQPLAAPDFVRHFLADTWCRVLLRAARLHGPHGELVRTLCVAGRDLFLSVQPKGTPAQRQEFVAQLPRLMQVLHRGIDMIGWPDDARHEFFGRLLPAHAQSLKGDGLSTLDYNLLTRQLDAALERVIPASDELSAAASGPIPLESGYAPLLTPGEAATVGLLTDDAVDWNGRPDADRGEDQPLASSDLLIQGLPEPEAPEPTRGAALPNYLQIGIAYQMHLDGKWQKVRLNHISPGRSFFVFSRGQRHRQAISLTHRMVVRLCETDRLRAFEAAYLLERATARARRQLAALRPTAAAA